MAVQSRGSHICMWRPLFGLRFRPCAAQGSCGLPGTYHAFRGGPLSRGVRTALELQGTYSTFCGRPRSRLPKAPQLVFLGYPRFFGGGGGGGGGEGGTSSLGCQAVEETRALWRYLSFAEISSSPLKMTRKARNISNSF